MFKPVLSIDVSKERSCAASYLSLNEPFEKPFSFSHTPQGMASVLQCLNRMENITAKRPEIILESTGNYSKLITFNLQEAGYSVILLNPILTHQQKRRSIRKVKTDPVDARRIAELFYLKKFDSQQLIDPNVAELRNFCRQYGGINALYTETQLRFRSILELLFPYYHSVFSDLCGDSSLKLLEAFPTPDSVLATNKKEVLRYLNTKYQRKSWTDEIYAKLMAAARASLPYKVAKQSNVRVLREYIKLLMTQKMSLTDIRAQIVAAAKEIPVFNLLLTIPGVGDITAATILAEIGDVNRFPANQQLVAYAGLDVSVHESGRFKATKNRISKRGSSYLRKALFQAAYAGIHVTKKGPVNRLLYDFYIRKISEGKKKMVALVATSSKLLRIIYGMWRKNEPFKLN